MGGKVRVRVNSDVNKVLTAAHKEMLRFGWMLEKNEQGSTGLEGTLDLGSRMATGVWPERRFNGSVDWERRAEEVLVWTHSTEDWILMGLHSTHGWLLLL